MIASAMKDKLHSMCATTTIALLTLAVTPAAALPFGGVIAQLDRTALPRLQRPALAPGQLENTGLTTEAAIRQAEERYGGRAVGAKPIQGPNGTIHRVKLLQPNGRLKTVIIP